jgi:hypothetical protein
MAALACLVGCQTSVLTPLEASADRPTGIDAGSETDAESLPDEGAPDASIDTPATPEAGPDVGARCQDRTTDRATIRVHLPADRVLGCDETARDGGSSLGPFVTFTGKIKSSSAGQLVMDLCEPGQSCVADGLRVEVEAPGLDLTGVPHVWAKLNFQSNFFFYCQLSLQIITANPPDDSPPDGPAGRLLLAVVDGGGTLPDSPYLVERARLGCSSARACGSPAPDEYAFEFSAGVADGRPPVRVYMGETTTWMNEGVTFAVRNLRSFQGAACDDYWNFAYFIAPMGVQP